jgi:dihydrolipoamide dehydrogenase
MLKNKGILHLYFSIRTRLLLGAEMCGPAAEHLGHLLAWTIEKKTTIDEMLRMPFYHPVIEEGLRTACRDAKKSLDILEKV